MAAPKPQKNFAFFVDGVRFESEKSVITGAEMRALAKVAPDYGLFLKQPVDKPDRQIFSSTSIDLAKPESHKYYTVVPTR